MSLVAFDGITTSGKTTTLDAVKEKLLSTYPTLRVIPERNRVRNLIDALDAGNLIRSELPPITESLFWTMNQVFRYETDLQGGQENDLVLIDRYVFTPVVYQYFSLKNQGVTLDDVISYITRPFGLSLPVPRSSIILLAPLDVLQKRFKSREGRNMDALEIELTERASEVYRQLQAKFPNYHVIESTRPVAELCEEVSMLILKDLEGE